MIKKILSILLASITAAGISGCVGNGNESAAADEPKNMEVQVEYKWENDGTYLKAAEWLTGNIENNTLLSFNYGGKAFSKIAGSWTKDVRTTTGERFDSYIITYTSPENVVLTVNVTLDRKFASLEWVCNFKNSSAKNSEVISDIYPADTFFEIPGADLMTANGSSCRADDFEPVFADLSTGKYIAASAGGRSSSGALPYFDICSGSEGVMGGIGWTGNWQAVFEKKDDRIYLTAGMQKISVSLFPDEEMRSPSMLVMFFSGDRDDGHNKFRQLILDTYTPADENGQTLTSLPFCISTWGGLGEDAILKTVDKITRLNLGQDVLWIDAGWYCSRISEGSSDTLWSDELGNWEVSKTLYPNGFSTIASRLAETDTDFLLWFEPERARKGTSLVNEYPQYYISGSSVYLFNLANDEACDFMTAQLSSVISENNIKWYRQDFNMEPASFWSQADREQGESRVGITEIKYITNLYRMLDTLVANNPGLLIDNCASGGRRLDFEMMRRSVPLWRTDYNLKAGSTTDEIRSINYNLSYWLPLSEGGCSSEGRSGDYDWRAMYAAGLDLGMASVENSLYVGGLEEFLECSKYMRGDYYILTQGTGDSLTTDYAVYEYYLPAQREGIVIVFRPKDCTGAKTTVRLKGLEKARTYTVDIVDTGETFTATGRELMELGLTIKLKLSGTSLLIKIH